MTGVTAVTSLAEVVRRSAAPLVAASVVVAGTAVAVFPQHTVSILRLLAVTVLLAVAATAGAAVFGLGGGPRSPTAGGGLGGSDSVFERPPHRTDGRPDPPGLGVIRSSLREDSLPAGRPLSARAERRLETVARSVLDRTGIDLGDPRQAEAVRAAAVRPATWAVLAGLTSSRPAADRRAPPTRERRPRPADVAAAAEVVHTVLDDLDRLDRIPGEEGDR